MARRARIVLAAAAGMEKAICVDVEADTNTVGKWRLCFAAYRLDGLLDEPRPGTLRRIGDDVADTIRRTLETSPWRHALVPGHSVQPAPRATRRRRSTVSVAA